MDSEIKIKRYESSDKDVWNDFLQKSKKPLFMFNRNYMEYHSDRFEDHSLLFYHKDKLIALLPVSQDDNEFISHGGLTYGGMVTGENMGQVMMMECFYALEKYCLENGIKGLWYKAVPGILHRQPAKEDLFALHYLGASIRKMEASTVIRLRDPLKPAKLRKRQVKKAARAGVIVRMNDQQSMYCKFMQLQDRVLRERHNVHAVHTGEEIYLLHSRFPDNIHLYTSELNGQLVGGTIVFIYENAVHTQYLCVDELGRNAGALDAAIYYVIEEYKDKKEWLDFGISTENGGRYLNQGLIQQKEGFGGRTNVYYTWKLTISRDEC